MLKMVHRSQSVKNVSSKLSTQDVSNLKATTSQSVDNLSATTTKISAPPDDDTLSSSLLSQSTTSLPDIKQPKQNVNVKYRRNSLNSTINIKAPPRNAGKSKKSVARKCKLVAPTDNKDEISRLMQAGTTTTTSNDNGVNDDSASVDKISKSENNNKSDVNKKKLTKSVQNKNNSCKSSNKKKNEKNCDKKFVVSSSSSSSSSSSTKDQTTEYKSTTGWSLNDSYSADNSTTFDGLALMLEQKEIAAQPPISICCSVPLERLSGILDTLMLPKKQKSSSELNQSQVNKSLCLYCDRSFGTQSLRLKHIERVHKAAEGRRMSARNSSSFESPSTSSGPFWPGCCYCTSNSMSATLISEDLTGLFQHLVDKHFDSYFACKPCSIRYATEEQLSKHMKVVHKIVIAKSSSRKPKPLTEEIKPINSTDSASIAQTDFDDTIPSLRVDKKESDDEPEEDVSIRVTRTSAKKKEMTAHETMLHRLGLSHFRSPRTRKGAKNRRGAPTEGRSAVDYYTGSSSSTSKSTRNSKSGRSSTTSSIAVASTSSIGVESTEFIIQKNRNEVLNCTFDEDFYDRVSVNVRKNLTCHLDGKLEVKIDDSAMPSAQSPPIISPLISAIRNNSVSTSPEKPNTRGQSVESLIHEATSLPTVTAFPTLLTVEQYGGSAAAAEQLRQQQNKTKKPITKNSWKWKWDCVKKYKYINEGGKIVKKVKQQQTGLRDLSKLDMWTQLAMRAKYESTQLQNSAETVTETDDSVANLIRRQEKCKVVEQLNQILDTRLIPQINLEQDDQRVIKLEKEDEEQVLPQMKNDSTSPCDGASDNVNEGASSSAISLQKPEVFVPELLNLRPIGDTSSTTSNTKVILSGEWARPRCYICYGCGAKLDNSKALEEHKTFRHPHIYSTHYEIVGRELLERELYKYFFIPSKALVQQKRCLEQPASSNSDSLLHKFKDKDSLNVEDSLDSLTSGSTATITTNSINTLDTDTTHTTSTTQTRSSSRIANQEQIAIQAQLLAASPQKSTACTKCKRESNGQLDLYRHMLDCSGDYAWIIAKKRMKYRRSRKRRGHHRGGGGGGRKPSTPAKDEERRRRLIEQRRSEHNKQLLQPKTRPGDAESIQRMLENLPPKRACRQILQNSTSKRRIRKVVVSPARKLPVASTITDNDPTRLQHPTTNIIPKTKKPTRKSTKIMRSIINSTKNRVTRSSLQILKIVDSNNSKRKIVHEEKLKKVSSRESSTTEKSSNTSSSSQSTEISTVSSEEIISTTTSSSTMPVSVDDRKIIEPKQEEDEVLTKGTENPTKQTNKQPFMKTLQQNTKRVIKKISQPFKKPQKIRTTRNSINQKLVEPVEEDIKETVNEDAEAEIENDPLPAVLAKKASTKSKLKKIVRKLSVRKTKTVKVAIKEPESTTLLDTAAAGIDSTELATTTPEAVTVLQPSADVVIEEAVKESEEKTLSDDKKDPLKKMLRNFRRKRKTVDEVEALESSNTSSEPEVLVLDAVTPEPKPTESGKSSHPLLKHILEAPSTSTTILPAISIAVTSNPSLPLYVHTASTESINELTTPRSSGPPTSPLKTPPGKKKVKRISDCIAMLTGKLQQKMGVPFFESTAPPIAKRPPKLLQSEISPMPLDMSSCTLSSSAIISSTPIDENGCLDLSLPKKNRDQNEQQPPQVIIASALPVKSNQQPTPRKPRKSSMPSVTIKQPIPTPPLKFTPDIPDNRAIIEKLLGNNVEVTQITGEPPINRRKPTHTEGPSPMAPSNVSKLNVSLLETSLKVAPENASTPNSSIGLSSRQSKEMQITLPSPVLPMKPLTEIDVKTTTKPTPEIKRILKESQFPAGLLQLHQNETTALIEAHEVAVNKTTEDLIVVKPIMAESYTKNLLAPKNISLNPFAIPIMEKIVPTALIEVHEVAISKATEDAIVIKPLMADSYTTNLLSPKNISLNPFAIPILEKVVSVAPAIELASVDLKQTEDVTTKPILAKPAAKKGKKCKKLMAKEIMEQNSSADQPSAGETSAETNQPETEDISKVLKGLVSKKRGRKPKSQLNSTNPDDATSSLSSINNSLNNLTLDSKNSSPEKFSDSQKAVEDTAKVVKPFVEDMWASEATTNVVTPKKTETRGRKPKVKAVAVITDEVKTIDTEGPNHEEKNSTDILPSKSVVDDEERELVNSLQLVAKKHGNKSRNNTPMQLEVSKTTNELLPKQDHNILLTADIQATSEKSAVKEPVITNHAANSEKPFEDVANEKPEVKIRKRRKNELAQIIADQLLESFKEVDKSRIDELKVLHDLSIENNVTNDELLVTTIRTTPTPRRKAAERVKDYQLDGGEKVRTASPAALKHVEDNSGAATTSKANEKKKTIKTQIVSEIATIDDSVTENELTKKKANKKAGTSIIKPVVEPDTISLNAEEATQKLIIDSSKPGKRIVARKTTKKADNVKSTEINDLSLDSSKVTEIDKPLDMLELQTADQSDTSKAIKRKFLKKKGLQNLPISSSDSDEPLKPAKKNIKQQSLPDAKSAVPETFEPAAAILPTAETENIPLVADISVITSIEKAKPAKTKTKKQLALERAMEEPKEAMEDLKVTSEPATFEMTDISVANTSKDLVKIVVEPESIVEKSIIPVIVETSLPITFVTTEITKPAKKKTKKQLALEKAMEEQKLKDLQMPTDIASLKTTTDNLKTRIQAESITLKTTTPSIAKPESEKPKPAKKKTKKQLALEKTMEEQALKEFVLATANREDLVKTPTAFEKEPEVSSETPPKKNKSQQTLEKAMKKDSSVENSLPAKPLEDVTIILEAEKEDIATKNTKPAAIEASPSISGPIEESQIVKEVSRPTKKNSRKQLNLEKSMEKNSLLEKSTADNTIIDDNVLTTSMETSTPLIETAVVQEASKPAKKKTRKQLALEKETLLVELALEKPLIDEITSDLVNEIPSANMQQSVETKAAKSVGNKSRKSQVFDATVDSTEILNTDEPVKTDKKKTRKQIALENFKKAAPVPNVILEKPTQNISSSELPNDKVVEKLSTGTPTKKRIVEKEVALDVPVSTEDVCKPDKKKTRKQQAFEASLESTSSPNLDVPVVSSVLSVEINSKLVVSVEKLPDIAITDEKIDTAKLVKRKIGKKEKAQNELVTPGEGPVLDKLEKTQEAVVPISHKSNKKKSKNQETEEQNASHTTSSPEPIAIDEHSSKKLKGRKFVPPRTTSAPEASKPDMKTSEPTKKKIPKSKVAVEEYDDEVEPPTINIFADAPIITTKRRSRKDFVELDFEIPKTPVKGKARKDNSTISAPEKVTAKQLKQPLEESTAVTPKGKQTKTENQHVEELVKDTLDVSASIDFLLPTTSTPHNKTWISSSSDTSPFSDSSPSLTTSPTSDTTESPAQYLPLTRKGRSLRNSSPIVPAKVTRKLDLDSISSSASTDNSLSNSSASEVRDESPSMLVRRSSARKTIETVHTEPVVDESNIFKTPTKRKTRLQQNLEKSVEGESPEKRILFDCLKEPEKTVDDAVISQERKRTRLENQAPSEIPAAPIPEKPDFVGTVRVQSSSSAPITTPTITLPTTISQPKRKTPMKLSQEMPIVIQRSDKRRSNREISEMFDRLKQTDDDSDGTPKSGESTLVKSIIDDFADFDVGTSGTDLNVPASPVKVDIPKITPFKVPSVEQNPAMITPPRRKSSRFSVESPSQDSKSPVEKVALAIPANDDENNQKTLRGRKIGTKRSVSVVSDDDDVILVESDSSINLLQPPPFRTLKEPGFNLINQLDDSNLNYFGNPPPNNYHLHPPPVSVVSTLLDFNDDTLFNDFDIEPTSKITDMVNDIIKNAEMSESEAEDDDLCLADIAKGMNGKIFPTADDGDLLLTEGLQKISLPELESLSQSKQSDELASEGKCLPSPPEQTPVIPSLFSADESFVDDEEEETNTDIIDMDIDDDVSVITDCTMNRSASSQNSSGTRGKRRKYRRCVLVKSKRQNKVVSTVDATGEELTFDCEICSKTFRKADSLAKHKMTLTHIAKLSEQEFLTSELQKEADAAKAAAEEKAEQKGEATREAVIEESAFQPTSTDVLEKIAIEASLAVAEVEKEPTDEVPEIQKPASSTIEEPVKPTTPVRVTPISSPAKRSYTPVGLPTSPLALNQSGIEPISSPEQLEPSSYGKYNVSSRNVATKVAAFDNSRMALSQEEKLFYECCSMLKGSSRHTSGSRPPIKPNEPQLSYAHDFEYDNNGRGGVAGGSNIMMHNSNLAYSVKSPMSNSRSSPRSAFPKVDTNQFSDISSDSNPIIFPGRSSQYAIKNKIFSSMMNEANSVGVHLPNFMSSAERYLNPYPSASTVNHQPEMAPQAMHFNHNPAAAATITSSSLPIQNYPDSFSDDSFPYSQGEVSESENYAQEPHTNAKARSQTPLSSSSNNNSPVHSIASSCSGMSKFRTKAALKGFDNLKVSIPTNCLDLGQALLKSAESKLAALADIALLGSTGGTSELNLKSPLDSALLPVIPVAAEPSSPKKQTSAKLTKAQAKKNVFGNNLGFKVTKKNKKSKAMDPGSSSPRDSDVYAFEESEDTAQNPEELGFRSKPTTVSPSEPPTPEKVLPALVLPDDDSQHSTTSYSDRDDCTFGVASPSTSNAEDGSDDSDSEDSTGVSSMALSKRIKRSIAIDADIEMKKSLIMGRIFKKKEKKEVPAIGAAGPAPEPRDFNRLFDTLRKPGDEEKPSEKPQKVVTIEKPKKKPGGKEAVGSAKAKKEEQHSNDRRSKHVKNKNIFTEIIDNATIIPELKKSGKSREVAKLEAEWGMSVEQIEEIIGIGNRKSTRRCAVGKQKILTETWSSDEYEDFHENTDDVIKMMEESTGGDKDVKKPGKSKQQSRNNSKNRTKKDTEKETTTETTATDLDPKEVVQKISEESVKENILQNDEKDEHEKSTAPANSAKKTNKKTALEDTSKPIGVPTKKKVSLLANGVAASKKQHRKKPMLSRRPKNIAYDSDSDFEIKVKPTVKPEKKRSPIKSRRKTTAFKEIKKPEPIDEVSTSASAKSTPKKMPAQRETYSDNETRVKFNLTNVSSGEKKKKNASGNPMMRRKRVASEMLYYWSSSSSDEEFGKISKSARENENDDDERFQQHGWIVGDSHKKLVTLLAHAKGKKSADDGGVKESVHRKKS